MCLVLNTVKQTVFSALCLSAGQSQTSSMRGNRLSNMWSGGHFKRKAYRTFMTVTTFDFGVSSHSTKAKFDSGRSKMLCLLILLFCVLFAATVPLFPVNVLFSRQYENETLSLSEICLYIIS